MPQPPPSLYLQDASGQVWLVGVTNAALLQTTPITGAGGAAVSGVPITDVSSGQLWNLIVEGPGPDPAHPDPTWGELHIDPIAGPCAPTQIPLQAPNGNLYAIQVNSGVAVGTSPLQTVLSSGLCPFSLADAQVALAARLYDPTMQFWTQAELTLYIVEALRTWNALTGYWRGDFTFLAAAGVRWYDLTDQVAMPTTLRPLTVEGSALATLIEYHLLEPPVGLGAWTGSAQFAISDIQGAIQRRRNQLLGVTGCSVQTLVLPARPGRTQLPNTVIDVRRIAYLPADPALPLTTLWQDDTWGLQAFEPGQRTLPAGVPESYTLSTEPWLTFDVDRPPLPGAYEITVVQVGAATPAAEGPCLPLATPDDWTWVIKWGALADLLSRESNAKDEARAAYCDQRWREGLALLAEAPALLGARIANLPMEIDSVRESDLYNVGWEAALPGPPQTMLVAGLNLVALSPAPDAAGGPYALTATVVQNAPVPSAPGDCILLGRDLFDVILDYAQHAACFKMGGAEFQNTMPLLNNFMKQAALYASKLQGQGEFARSLYALSQREEHNNPRYAESGGPTEEE